jgi:hypothetical protein
VVEAFWDSSALVLLCVNQPASGKADAMAEKFALTAWWAARVEMRSAIARLHRSGDLQPAARTAAVEDAKYLSETWREISPSDEIRDQAAWLLDRYPLRAADSLQLAAALAWCRNRPKGRTFICADARLCEAAALAGFTVFAP